MERTVNKLKNFYSSFFISSSVFYDGRISINLNYGFYAGTHGFRWLNGNAIDDDETLSFISYFITKNYCCCCYCLACKNFCRVKMLWFSFIWRWNVKEEGNVIGKKKKMGWNCFWSLDSLLSFRWMMVWEFCQKLWNLEFEGICIDYVCDIKEICRILRF